MPQSRHEPNEESPLIEYPAQRKASSKNDGYFEQVPTEIIMYLLTFVNLKSIASFSETNKRMNQTAKETKILLDESSSELTYSKICKQLNIVKPKQQKLKNYENDLIDNKLFKNSQSYTFFYPIGLGFALAVLSAIGNIIAIKYFNASALEISIPSIITPAVSGSIGSIFCLVRKIKIDKEKEKLKREIAIETPKGLWV